MANAKHDDNRIPTLLGTLNSDGVTPIPIQVEPTYHGLCVDNGIAGSSIDSDTIQRDGNRVTTLWGVSSTDGVTPLPIYCDSNGKLLIKST